MDLDHLFNKWEYADLFEIFIYHDIEESVNQSFYQQIQVPNNEKIFLILL
jgi:hypothetical protein